jgi:dimethylglycine dehydrogenase
MPAVPGSYHSFSPGSDLTAERTPLESGLSFLVRHEDREFVGRDAMLAKPNPWDMVLLDIETTDVDPFYSHTVFAGDRPVGIVTSGAQSHRTGKTLALLLRNPESTIMGGQ